MTLSTGTKLSHYEITSQIGKGGMGEVYQAKDTKLGRDVAIKVLPQEFAQDADRVARFQREAKLLASLNHPNIAAIHGLEEVEGTNFLVMELVEGQTLDDRIKSGAIPVEESLKLALQIAEALEAAHEKGVIHRDLKPANIKVTPDEKVKVLDFGLAKAFAGEQTDLNLSNSPTLSVAATQQGVILGTAAYMSPEQARGKEVDKRADIWAFGVVLFEMLTGKQVFTGDTVSDTLASVLAREPEWQSLPLNLHPRIRLLLERCLKKEPKNRYHDIADARVDIQEVLADPSGVLVRPVTAEELNKKLKTMLPWIAAAIIVAGIAGWLLKPAPSPDPKLVIRYDYELPEEQKFGNMGRPTMAVSRDGKKIVYVANNQLFLKYSNSLTARPIPDTDEDPVNPFFSPDGQRIGYFDLANKQLKKISIGGVSPIKLCDVKDPISASWETDNSILFGDVDGIMRVPDIGGNPKIIVKAESGQNLSFPQILPDKNVILFTELKQGHFNVAVKSLDSGKSTILFPGGQARYISTGHLIYTREDSLYAVPFDPDTLESGEEVFLIKGISRAYFFSPSQFFISQSGMLGYLPGTYARVPEEKNVLVWVDRQGKRESLGTPPKAYRVPTISPDGSKLAVCIVDNGKSNISIWDIDQKKFDPLTTKEHCGNPVWSPDGTRIAFRRDNQEEESVYWKVANGVGSEELVRSGKEHLIVPLRWLPDEIGILVLDILRESNINIGILSLKGDYEPLLQEKYVECDPNISPNGEWMAYQSTESGRGEIWVCSFPDVTKGRRQISQGGGQSPLWSLDGTELFYRSNDEIVAVAIQTEPDFSPGKHDVLFRWSYQENLTDPFGWDINPHDSRFLMREPVEADNVAQQVPQKIIFVFNWVEELKDRMSVQ